MDGNLAMNSHFENMSEKDMNDRHDHYLSQQQRPRWVKADERLPAERKTVHLKDVSEDGSIILDHGEFHQDASQPYFSGTSRMYPVNQIGYTTFWLDESPVTSTREEKAIRTYDVPADFQEVMNKTSARIAEVRPPKVDREKEREEDSRTGIIMKYLIRADHDDDRNKRYTFPPGGLGNVMQEYANQELASAGIKIAQLEKRLKKALALDKHIKETIPAIDPASPTSVEWQNGYRAGFRNGSIDFFHTVEDSFKRYGDQTASLQAQLSEAQRNLTSMISEALEKSKQLDEYRKMLFEVGEFLESKDYLAFSEDVSALLRKYPQPSKPSDNG